MCGLALPTPYTNNFIRKTHMNKRLLPHRVLWRVRGLIHRSRMRGPRDQAPQILLRYLLWWDTFLSPTLFLPLPPKGKQGEGMCF